MRKLITLLICTSLSLNSTLLYSQSEADAVISLSELNYITQGEDVDLSELNFAEDYLDPNSELYQLDEQSVFDIETMIQEDPYLEEYLDARIWWGSLTLITSLIAMKQYRAVQYKRLKSIAKYKQSSKNLEKKLLAMERTMELRKNKALKPHNLKLSEIYSEIDKDEIKPKIKRPVINPSDKLYKVADDATDKYLNAKKIMAKTNYILDKAFVRTTNTVANTARGVKNTGTRASQLIGSGAKLVDKNLINASSIIQLSENNIYARQKSLLKHLSLKNHVALEKMIRKNRSLFWKMALLRITTNPFVYRTATFGILYFSTMNFYTMISESLLVSSLARFINPLAAAATALTPGKAYAATMDDWYNPEFNPKNYEQLMTMPLDRFAHIMKTDPAAAKIVLEQKKKSMDEVSELAKNLLHEMEKEEAKERYYRSISKPSNSKFKAFR